MITVLNVGRLNKLGFNGGRRYSFSFVALENKLEWKKMKKFDERITSVVVVISESMVRN
jgi:hypothetical protein